MMSESENSNPSRPYRVYTSARSYARDRKTLDFTWRLIVLVLGVSLLGLGLFFMLFPGPGWATIILGLIILGSEYAWARRALNPIQSTASRLAQRARDRAARDSSFSIAVVATGLLTAFVYVYLGSFGFTMAPIVTALRALIPGF